MKNIKNDLIAFMQWTGSSVLSTLYLGIWILLQWAVKQLINLYQLSTIDNINLMLLQWLFSIATLIPIAAYIFKHSILTLIETWKTITNEFDQ